MVKNGTRGEFISEGALLICLKVCSLEIEHRKRGQFRMRRFLLTVGSFLLTVELFLLTVDNFSLFAHNWSFFCLQL